MPVRSAHEEAAQAKRYMNLALKEGVRAGLTVSRIISLSLEFKTIKWMNTKHI